MIKRIKGSLGAKILIGVLVILLVVSLVIYGSIRLLMPRAFEQEQNGNLNANLQSLVKQLETSPIESFESLILQFALNNRTNIKISDQNNNNIVATGLDYGPASDDLALTSMISFENAGVTYLIQTESVAHSVDQLEGTFSRVLPIIIPLILILSLLTALLYSRIIAKPILDISDISRKMTTLDMSWRCKVNRSDEIGVLSSNLNDMAERLGRTLEELQSANRKVQEDIEEKQQQEKQRVDFFRAVSHELKTPITILKGELEGMIYGVGEYKDRDTSLRHTMKTVVEMENIVKEILSASRMAAADLTLSVSEFSLDELVGDCCRKVQGIAEDKGIHFLTTIEPCSFQGDKNLLQKAISNMIGNAMMHSPVGAAVTVSLLDGELTVENTGVHIEPEDLEQLFEPFYRVDRSRNSDTGGSGLGLYIVKTILDRHHLCYQLENMDTGVRFTVKLG